MNLNYRLLATTFMIYSAIIYTINFYHLSFYPLQTEISNMWNVSSHVRAYLTTASLPCMLRQYSSPLLLSSRMALGRLTTVCDIHYKTHI